MKKFISLIALLFVSFTIFSYKIFLSQKRQNEIGNSIVYYANNFINTPYDRIPIGVYVKERKLIIDKEVDCMYLVFRVVSLALANGDNDKSQKIACDKMFQHKCKLDKFGLIANYEDRFAYGEDMINSGKYGKSIFNKINTSNLKGARMYKYFTYVKSEDFITNKYLQRKVSNGNIVFLYKDPTKRSKANEAIGHLGILEIGKDGIIYFIHASGSKGLTKPQGKVRKVIFMDYLKQMSKFVGIDILRI